MGGIGNGNGENERGDGGNGGVVGNGLGCRAAFPNSIHPSIANEDLELDGAGMCPLVSFSFSLFSSSPTSPDRCRARAKNKSRVLCAFACFSSCVFISLVVFMVVSLRIHPSPSSSSSHDILPTSPPPPSSSGELNPASDKGPGFNRLKSNFRAAPSLSLILSTMARVLDAGTLLLPLQVPAPIKNGGKRGWGDVC